MEPETIVDDAFTVGGFERFDKSVEIYARAFYTDPGFTWTLNSHSDEQRRIVLKDFMHVLIRACLLNDGPVTTLGDWKTVAIMLPPGKKLDNIWTMPAAGLFRLPSVIGFAALWKTLWHADSAFGRAKKLHMPKAPCFYLFIIATPEEYRGSGCGTRMLKHLQEQAASQDAHIWLEASSEDSMRLYQRCGFVIQEVIHLGIGEADATGKKCPGGEGIRIWAMLWSPPAKTGR